MTSSLSMLDFVDKRYRLAGRAILDIANPWFLALDQLRNQLEAEGAALTSFANYDYLGISGHPRVREAAARAAASHGTGVLGSRLVGGERTFHRDLERAIADFMGAEEALTLVSGYLTNASLIPHLLGSNDILIVDELSHNSIVAGSRAARARLLRFRHNDLDHLDAILKKYRRDARQCMIVVEGLYSMDGDMPDLPRLLDLKDKHKAWLLVDEAHSFGVLGQTGRGISEHFGEDPERIDLVIGTLSKALVSCGGFVCAKRKVIDFLRFTLGGFVYSVGLSPPVAAAARTALDILIAEPERVAAVGRVAEQFLSKARRAGLETGRAIGKGIVPVMFRDFEETLLASQALLRANIYAPPIVHVGVPKDCPRIRFFLSAAHDGDPAIDTAIATIAESIRRPKPRPSAPVPASHGSQEGLLSQVQSTC